MALSSMTGFARGHGASAGGKDGACEYGWAWEIKSVNGKGLDLRLRLPPGWDAVEPAVRAKAAAVLSRGTIHATLTVERQGKSPVVRVNEEVLGAVLAAMTALSGRLDAERPRLDGILGIKSRSAVREMQIKFGLPADSWPTAELLTKLRQTR